MKVVAPLLVAAVAMAPIAPIVAADPAGNLWIVPATRPSDDEFVRGAVNHEGKVAQRARIEP